VSDDNPFSDTQSKTVKYHPGFPNRFHDIEAAITFCRSPFPSYNTEHGHGGIAMLTPDDVHHARVKAVLEQRERALHVAGTKRPERFVQGLPNSRPFPEEVWMNPSLTSTNRGTAQQIAIASVAKSLAGSGLCRYRLLNFSESCTRRFYLDAAKIVASGAGAKFLGGQV
jgi:hypothetical protein